MEKDNKNADEVSFIKRLTARFHETKIAQKIGSLIVGGAMIFNLAACNNDKNDNTNNNDDSHISDTTNNNNSNNSNTNQQPDFSQYSELLQHVLTDEYYVDVMQKMDAGIFKFGEGYFAPVPYSFLEDEGYDVEQLKQNNLAFGSSFKYSQKEPNNLYMQFNVKTEGATPYYTQYLVRYTLTDKEMEDYAMIYYEHCYQAPLLTQAISDFKTPEILGKTKLSVEAYESLMNDLKQTGQSIFPTLLKKESYGNAIITDVDNENNLCTMMIMSAVPKESLYSMFHGQYIAKAVATSRRYDFKISPDDIVCSGFDQFSIYFDPESNTIPGEYIINYTASDLSLRYTSDFTKEQ